MQHTTQTSTTRKQGLTEYESLMNQAAQEMLFQTFPNRKAVTIEFIAWMEEKSGCYSIEGVKRDAITCLRAAQHGKIWKDYKNRRKHDPETLRETRERCSQPSSRDADDRLIAGVIDAIMHSDKLTTKKHKRTRKVIGQ